MLSDDIFGVIQTYKVRNTEIVQMLTWTLLLSQADQVIAGGTVTSGDVDDVI